MHLGGELHPDTCALQNFTWKINARFKRGEDKSNPTFTVQRMISFPQVGFPR